MTPLQSNRHCIGKTHEGVLFAGAHSESTAPFGTISSAFGTLAGGKLRDGQEKALLQDEVRYHAPLGLQSERAAQRFPLQIFSDRAQNFPVRALHIPQSQSVGPLSAKRKICNS